MESPRITRLGQQGATYPGWQDRLHRGARFLEASRARAEASEEMALPNDERIHGGGLEMEGCEGTGEGKAKTSSSPGTRDIVTAMPAMPCRTLRLAPGTWSRWCQPPSGAQPTEPRAETGGDGGGFWRWWFQARAPNREIGHHE